jgi:hypothetical protein
MTHVLDFQTLAPSANYEDGVLGGSITSWNCGTGSSSMSTSGCGGGGGGGSQLSVTLCQ